MHQWEAYEAAEKIYKALASRGLVKVESEVDENMIKGIIQIVLEDNWLLCRREGAPKNSSRFRKTAR